MGAATSSSPCHNPLRELCPLRMQKLRREYLAETVRKQAHRLRDDLDSCATYSDAFFHCQEIAIFPENVAALKERGFRLFTATFLLSSGRPGELEGAVLDHHFVCWKHGLIDFERDILAQHAFWKNGSRVVRGPPPPTEPDCSDKIACYWTLKTWTEL